MSKRRVVITGVGVISPNGIGKDNLWKGMSSGISGVSRVSIFDVSKFHSQIAAQVQDFDPFASGLTIQEVARMDRYVQFAVVATKEAVDDAKIDFLREDPTRCGITLSNAICGTKYMEEEFLRVTKDGVDHIDPRFVRPDLYDASMFNTPSSEIAARYKIKGLCNTISTGCTAGSDSVGFAFDIIKDGDVDVMIAGASEAPLTPITFGAFDVVNVLSNRNDEPQKASRPFDNKRNGFVLSEGCGILILEELNHALRRGAHIYCEVIGFGTSCNAYHMTDLPSDGVAMAKCINLALEDAGVKSQEIDYINAHGSSTRMNDVFETKGYKISLGDYAYKVPISSLKSMIGHPLAAANAVELVTTSLMYDYNIIPPTINQEERDPECDLNYVPNEAISAKVNTILKTSSGFSGIHSSLVFRRYS